MPDLSYFASLNFYAFLFAAVAGAFFVLWGVIWLRQAMGALDGLSLDAALKWLGNYGVSIPRNLDEQGEPEALNREEVLALYRYTRQFTGIVIIGIGVGLILGALLSVVANWLLSRVQPAVANASPVLGIDLTVGAPLYIGVISGVCISILFSVGYWRKQASKEYSTSVNASEQPLPTHFHHSRWFFLLEGSVIACSLAISFLLAMGIVPEQPLVMEKGESFTTLPPPLWLVFSAPVAFIAFWLCAEVYSQFLARASWPLPSGVTPLLAERARRAAQTRSIFNLWVFEAFLGWMLILHETSLAQIDSLVRIAGIVLVVLPILVVGIAPSLLRRKIASPVKYGQTAS